MADGDESLEDRTEDASQTRRDEFRKDGKVLNSKDLSSAALLIGTTLALYFSAHWSLQAIWNSFVMSFQEMPRYIAEDWTPKTVMPMIEFAFRVVLYASAPVCIAGFLIGTLSSIAQGGFTWTTKPLELDPAKLNPLTGLQRIFSMEGFFELGKSIAKFLIAGVVVWAFLIRRLKESPVIWDWETNQLVSFMAYNALLILVWVGGAMLIVAGFDYAFQRYRFEARLRMTKEEAKEDRKNVEGNPQTRARVRALQRRIATSKMVQAVKTADVVITNPTHIAIALLYDREKMDAPRIVAKGADHMAQRIKQIAKENGVPCVENVPLARALWRALKIGEFVSRDFFNAVAEVLAYVYRLKGKVQL
jgi:flagellar biosynthetic protein FlhB